MKDFKSMLAGVKKLADTVFDKPWGPQGVSYTTAKIGTTPHNATWGTAGDRYFAYRYQRGFCSTEQLIYSNREEIRIETATDAEYDLIGGGPWWTHQKNSFIFRRVKR